MTIKDFLPIVIPLISAAGGYQFSRRSKGNDMFLDGLSKSYENVYYPMYVQMKKIKELEINDRDEIINEFFERYNSDVSTTKFIASTFILEWYLEMYQKYEVYTKTRDETCKAAILEKL